MSSVRSLRPSLVVTAALVLLVLTGFAQLLAAPLPGSSPDENIRRRYMPVTLTQQGWRQHTADLLYPKFRYAFARFSFYGRPSPGRLKAGGRFTITYDSTTASVSRLSAFLPQTGPCRSLMRDYVSPWAPTEAGALAGEVIALTLNVAFNDERLMPRQPGYDLERFVICYGPMRGRNVGQVLDIGHKVLGGISPIAFGFPSHAALADVLAAINANYEFVNYDTYYDRGYLLPYAYFGPAAPAHAPHVP